MTAILKQLEGGAPANSLEETISLAEQLAPMLPEDITLCLQGPVGSGKTSFTSALAKALGAQSPVTSPSYNLLSVHKTQKRTILHLDAYRLDQQTSGETLSLDDLMESPWLLIVEWPENIPNLLPPKRWWLRFDITGEKERVIELDIPGNSKLV